MAPKTENNNTVEAASSRDPKRRRLRILCKKTELEPRDEDIKPEGAEDETTSAAEDDSGYPSHPRRRCFRRLQVKTKPERRDGARQAHDPKSAVWLSGVRRRPAGRVNDEVKRASHDDDVPINNPTALVQKRNALAKANEKKSAAMSGINDRTRRLHPEVQRHVLKAVALGPRRVSPCAPAKAASSLTSAHARHAPSMTMTMAPESSGGGSGVAAVAPSKIRKIQRTSQTRQSGLRGVSYQASHSRWQVSFGALGRLYFRVSDYRTPDRGEEEACEAARQAAAARRIELVNSGEAQVINRHGKASERVSGITGVTWHATRNCWMVRLCLQGRVFSKQFTIGSPTEEAIEQARLAAVACREELDSCHLDLSVKA